MATIVREEFAAIRSWVGSTVIDNSADSIPVLGQSITFMNISGNIWINPKATAVADATAIKLVAGQSIDLVVNGNLSIISDVTGGFYQYIIWDM